MSEEKTLPSFLELYNLDLSDVVKKKPTFYKDKSSGRMQKTDESKWLSYLEWSTILRLLYENGAKSVVFEAQATAQGHIVRYDAKGGAPYLKMVVWIDDKEHSLNYPVISGSTANREPNQLQIHVAEMRAFAKCVAVNTGLGLSLWNSEEQKLNEDGAKDLEITNRDLHKRKNEEMFAAVGKIMKVAGCTADDIFVLIGMTRKEADLLVKNHDVGALDTKNIMLDNLQQWVNADKKSLMEALKKS